MQDAETVLAVLRERGRKGLPCDELYRQLFNKELYLLAYGRIYANQGAMTPGASAETADGMSEAKIDRIIEAMRHERYRFAPARRTFIPKKNGKMRPLGLPTDVANRPFAQAAFGFAAGDVSVPPSGRAISGDLVLEAAWRWSRIRLRRRWRGQHHCSDRMDRPWPGGG
jgi:hypothetical protein